METVSASNKLIRTILIINHKLEISILRGNVSEVGTYIAFSADQFIGSTNSIFNQCFKTIGLIGACY